MCGCIRWCFQQRRIKGGGSEEDGSRSHRIRDGKSGAGNPELAEPLVRVLATGRSDYPNQINNVLVFPGIFLGALDCQAKTINEEMKLAAARAIASVVTEDELNEYYIILSIFNEKVVSSVHNAVLRAAIDTGVARRIPKDFR